MGRPASKEQPWEGACGEIWGRILKKPEGACRPWEVRAVCYLVRLYAYLLFLYGYKVDLKLTVVTLSSEVANVVSFLSFYTVGQAEFPSSISRLSVFPVP